MMNNHGIVEVRNRNKIETCTLLGFVPVSIPVKNRLTQEETFKSIVYGVVENEDGSFYAKQLSEIKRKK